MRHRGFGWLCGAVLMGVLLFSPPGTQWARAANGPEARAAFGMLPTKYDPNVPETRSYFVFSATPGQTIPTEVRVVNSGKAAGTMRLYAVDGLTSDATGTAFHAATDRRVAVGDWVRIAKEHDTLTLGPGEERIVPFTVAVPKDATPGQHVGGLVAENAGIGAAGDDGAQVSVRSRSILAVQLNLPGETVERLTASGVTAGGDGGYQTLTVALRNDGTHMVKPIGTLRVKEMASGRRVQEIPIKMDTFLPQTAISYPAYVQGKALEAGEYEAQLDLTFGERGELHYTTRFSISRQQTMAVFAGTVNQPVQAPAAANGNASGVSAARTAASTSPFGSATDWTPIGAATGGGLLLLLLLVGAFALGRRRT